MDDLIIFEFLRDETIPEDVRKDLKKAFESFNVKKVNKIVENILLVKTTSTLLNLK